MPKPQPTQHIHIQRLVVRTRGLPKSTVRAALSGLDAALLAEAARHPGLRQNSAVIDRLNLAPVQARGDSYQLRHAIATQVIQAIPPSSPHHPLTPSSSPAGGQL